MENKELGSKDGPAGGLVSRMTHRARGLVLRADRPRFRTSRLAVWLIVPLLLIPLGCAKFNTYYNAKRSFDNAEQVREEALKRHEDPKTPGGAQKNDYEAAIKKAQKILDEYPGHDLTDDALFLQAKAHHRLESYRQSIRKLTLLFQNFPATPYMEEALYLQGLNYLLIGALDSSQDFLDQLAKSYPKSKYQAETRKVSGDNAFAMKDWTSAADSYREYLALDGEVAERDRIGLKLAECYWELEEYYPAAEVLQEVSQNTESADLAFRARLLRSRVHVRMQDYEIVELLVSQLRDEAEIYRAQGEVLLVEAEALVAQGRADEVAPLLQSMPSEWETPAVKARAAEIMGRIFLDRGEWEKAREKYQTALLKKDELEDEDAARQISSNLKDYLAADQALPDAPADRVPRLKLLQANALLFGFDRPNMAATLYGEAAIDTAADTTDAVRALYGAYLSYDQYLDHPDSAEIMRTALIERFPDSPQAFEVSSETSTDLLGYLLAVKSEQQSLAYADLSDEERLELQVLGEVDVAALGIGLRPMDGVRRRMVYFARRDNLLFNPPERAVQMISERQKQLIEAQALDAARQAEFDSLQTQGVGLDAGAAGTTTEAVDEFGRTTPVDGIDPVTGEPLKQESTDGAVQSEAEKAAADKAAEEKAAEEKAAEEKKKKKDKNWDFLR